MATRLLALARRYRADLRAAALAIAAALVYAAAFAKTWLWPLHFLVPAMLLAAVIGQGWRRRVALGGLFGALAFGIVCRWVLRFGVIALAGLALGHTLWWAGTAWIAGPFLRSDRPVRGAAAFAGLWVVSDLLRGRLPFGGFPWGELGLPLVTSPMRWVVPWLGALGLTAAAALVGSSVWLATRRPVTGLVLVSGVVGVCLVAWLVRPGGPNGPSLRVAAVQGNVPLPVRLASRQRDAQVLANHERVTMRITRHVVDLVVWPEAIVQTQAVHIGAGAPKPLGRLARDLSVWFVAGVSADGPDDRFFNLAVSVDRRGTVAGATAKVHGVPFGEYVPWRSVLGDKFGLSAVARDLEPGRRVRAIPIPRGHAAVAISYEVAFSDVLRAGVRDGGRVLLVPTNVSSYGPHSPIARQELLEAQARALEERMWLVQAGPSGISAIVDASGRVHAQTRLFEATIVRGRVQLATAVTPYAHWGDTPIIVLALAAVLPVLAPSRKRHVNSVSAVPIGRETA